MRILASILSFAFSVSAFAQVTEADRLQRLNVEMERLHEHARFGRYVMASTFTALGVGLGIGAIVADKSSTKRDAALAGAISLGVGVAAFAMPSDRERMTERYLKTPAGTDSERLVKLGKGEAYLEEIGDTERRGRFMGVAILGAFGVGYLVAAAVVDPDDYPDRNIRAEFATSGAIFGAAGLAFAFLPSDGERAYRRYERWRNGQADVAAWNFGVSPTPGRGLMAGLQLAY